MATARPGSSAAASGSAAAADSASAADTGTPEAAAIPNTRKYISRCCDSNTRSRCVPSATLLFCVFSREGPPPSPPRPPPGLRADFLRFFFSSVMSFLTPQSLLPRPRAHRILCQSSSTRSCSPRRRTSRRPRLPSSRPLPSSLSSSFLCGVVDSHPFLLLLLLRSPRRRRLVGRPRWSRTSCFPNTEFMLDTKKKSLQSRSCFIIKSVVFGGGGGGRGRGGR